MSNHFTQISSCYQDMVATIGETLSHSHISEDTSDTSPRPLLSFVLELLKNSPSTANQTTVNLAQSIMNHCFKLSTLPSTNLNTDPSIMGKAHDIIQSRGNNTYVSQIESIFKKHHQHNTDTSVTDPLKPWRHRALQGYERLQEQAVLMVSRLIASDKSHDDIALRLTELDNSLSQITACETALIREYTRLAATLSQDTTETATAHDFRSWVFSELEISLVEPGIQAILIDHFTKSGQPFSDVYNNAISPTMAAVDHHSYFIGHGIATQLFNPGPQIRDYYRPLLGVKDVFSDRRIVTDVQQDMLQLLSYTEISKSLMDCPALLAAYLNTKKPDELVTMLASVGIMSTDEEALDTSAIHFDHLRPALTHDLLIDTGIMVYKTPTIDTTVFAENLTRACLDQDLGSITQLFQTIVPKITATKIIQKIKAHCVKNKLDPISLSCTSNSGWWMKDCIETNFTELSTRMGTYNEAGITPIHDMLRRGATQALKTLANHDKTKHDFKRWVEMSSETTHHTSMAIAADQTQFESMTFLFDHIPNIARHQSIMPAADRRTAFHITATSGDSRCFNALIDHTHAGSSDKIDFLNRQFSQTDAHGKNVLHYAVDGQNTDIVRTIVSISPHLVDTRIDQSDKLGFTPVALAIISRQPDLLRIFSDSFSSQNTVFQAADTLSLAAVTEDFRIIGALFRVADETDLFAAIKTIFQSKTLSNLDKIRCEHRVLQYHRDHVTDEHIDTAIEHMSLVPYAYKEESYLSLVSTVHQTATDSAINRIYSELTYISHENFAKILSIMSHRIPPETMAKHLTAIGINAHHRHTNSAQVAQTIFSGRSLDYLNDTLNIYFKNKEISAPPNLPLALIETLHFRFSSTVAKTVVALLVQNAQNNFSQWSSTNLITALNTLGESHLADISAEAIQTTLGHADHTQLSVNLQAKLPSKYVVDHLIRSNFSEKSMRLLDVFFEKSQWHIVGPIVDKLNQSEYLNTSSTSRFFVKIANKPRLLEICAAKINQTTAKTILLQLIFRNWPILTTEKERNTHLILNGLPPSLRDPGLSAVIDHICKQENFTNRLISTLDFLQPYLTKTLLTSSICSIWGANTSDANKDALVDYICKTLIPKMTPPLSFHDLN